MLLYFSEVTHFAFYQIYAFYQELVLIKAEVRDLPATLAPKGDFISQSMMHSIRQHDLHPTT